MLTQQLAVVLGGPAPARRSPPVRRSAQRCGAAAAGRERAALQRRRAKRRRGSRRRSAPLALRQSGHVDSTPLAAPGELRATTIHRLLGSRPATQVAIPARCREPAAGRRGRRRRVVDVALPLMKRLVEALPPAAHLVLLGDPHQLEASTSVPCSARWPPAADPASAVAGSVVTLTRRFRGAALDTLAAIGEAVRVVPPTSPSICCAPGARRPLDRDHRRR